MALKQHVNTLTHKHGRPLDLIIPYSLNNKIYLVIDLAKNVTLPLK